MHGLRLCLAKKQVTNARRKARAGTQTRRRNPRGGHSLRSDARERILAWQQKAASPGGRRGRCHFEGDAVRRPRLPCRLRLADDFTGDGCSLVEVSQVAWHSGLASLRRGPPRPPDPRARATMSWHCCSWQRLDLAALASTCLSRRRLSGEDCHRDQEKAGKMPRSPSSTQGGLSVASASCGAAAHWLTRFGDQAHPLRTDSQCAQRLVERPGLRGPS